MSYPEFILFILFGFVFGLLAAIMAFLITFEEWQHHGFSRRESWREPAVRAFYTFLFFFFITLAIGYALQFTK